MNKTQLRMFALDGIQAKRQQLQGDLKILDRQEQELRGFVGRRGPGRPGAQRKRRQISAAGRKRLSIAMKKRWAAQKKAEKTTSQK